MAKLVRKEPSKKTAYEKLGGGQDADARKQALKLLGRKSKSKKL